MLHQGSWDRSDPRGGDWMATTGSIPTAARGVDTKGLRPQYQGSVGDGSDWNTGVSKLTRGH